MNKLPLFAVLSTFCFIVIGKTIDNYCWRDYEGEIPSDALVSGKDQNGRPLYLGQVLFENKIIPGKIYEGDNKIYFEYFNAEYSASQNVKILCSKQVERLQWVPTNNANMHEVTANRVLIKGGFEPNCSTYLGRIQKNQELNVGKVMCCKGVADCYGIYTTFNGTGQLDGAYEVLTYNENILTANLPTKIEITQDNPDRHVTCKKITINLFN